MKKLVLSIIAVTLLVMPFTAFAGSKSPVESANVKQIVDAK